MGKREKEHRAKVVARNQSYGGIMQRVGRSVALKSLVGTGTKNLRKMIANGTVKKDVPVDLQHEVAEMKRKFSEKDLNGLAMVGISDVDLEGVIRKICQKNGLKIQGA